MLKTTRKSANGNRAANAVEDAGAATGPRTPRKAAREVRRRQLIEATIVTLAQKGQTGLKLQDVAEAAGLSYGLVNFHFETKDRLLSETLRFMSEEYKHNWQEALAGAGNSPEQQLDAIVRADFNDRICTTNRLLTWCTYWGEAQSRPYYQRECGANDEAYIRALDGICTRVAAAQKAVVKGPIAARVIRNTIEGVWLDLMWGQGNYSRKHGLRTAFTCVAALFPRAFDEHGLKRELA